MKVGLGRRQPVFAGAKIAISSVITRFLAKVRRNRRLQKQVQIAFEAFAQQAQGFTHLIFNGFD